MVLLPVGRSAIRVGAMRSGSFPAPASVCLISWAMAAWLCLVPAGATGAERDGGAGRETKAVAGERRGIASTKRRPGQRWGGVLPSLLASGGRRRDRIGSGALVVVGVLRALRSRVSRREASWGGRPTTS